MSSLTPRHVRFVIHDELGALRPRLAFAHLVIGLVGQRRPSFVTRLMRFAGVRIGADTLVSGPVRISGSTHPASNLRMGARCRVGMRCTFDVSAPIAIGDDVDVGQETLFVTGTHEIGPPGRRAAELKVAPITVGDGARIGARVIVLPGLTIGDGAVVGPGSVVTSDVPAGVEATGVPARVVTTGD